MTRGSKMLIVMRIGSEQGARFNLPRSTVACGGVHHVVGSASTCLHGCTVSLPIQFSLVAIAKRRSSRVGRVRSTFRPSLFWPFLRCSEVSLRVKRLAVI